MGHWSNIHVNGSVEKVNSMEETVGWTTRRCEYPLPAQPGEGQEEVCLEPVEVVFGQCLQGVPPRPFVAGKDFP